MLKYVYTMVFAQELPSNKAVKQVRKELRRLFEAEEVSTNDNRRFSFTTTISARVAESAVNQFGREDRRRFIVRGLSINEVGWSMCGHPANSHYQPQYPKHYESEVTGQLRRPKGS